MNLQYFFQYFLPRGWAIGTSPNMLVNWYTSGGNKVTFPIGVQVSKVQKFGRLPVKFCHSGAVHASEPGYLRPEVEYPGVGYSGDPETDQGQYSGGLVVKRGPLTTANGKTA